VLLEKPPTSNKTAGVPKNAGRPDIAVIQEAD
jgi:hypothetical protein